MRSIIFHRVFPETKASPSTIRRIYTVFKIKYKAIKRGKHHIDFSNPTISKRLADLNRGLTNTINDGMKIVWLDEAVFSFNTFAKRAWYLNRDKLLIPEKAYQV
jgi:hypothetical protein